MASALRVPRAVTRLTVYRSPYIRRQRDLAGTGSQDFGTARLTKLKNQVLECVVRITRRAEVSSSLGVITPRARSVFSYRSNTRAEGSVGSWPPDYP